MLGSMHADIGKPQDCPANVMPTWLSRLVVPLFDGLSKEDAVAWGLRFGKQMQSEKWVSVDWKSVETDFNVFVIQQVVDAAEPVSKDLKCWPAALKACKQVQEALKGNGNLEDARKAADAAYADAAYADASYAAYAAAAAYADAAAAYADAASYAASAASAYAYAASDAAYAASDAAYAYAAARKECRKQQADKLCELINRY
jgi:hypothetical protein